MSTAPIGRMLDWPDDQPKAKPCKHSRGHVADWDKKGHWRYTCVSCLKNITCTRCGRSKRSITIKCDHKGG